MHGRDEGCRHSILLTPYLTLRQRLNSTVVLVCGVVRLVLIASIPINGKVESTKIIPKRTTIFNRSAVFFR